MTRKGFWFAPRPPDTEHHHPFLVFDRSDRLCFHLTVYGKEAVARLSVFTTTGMRMNEIL
jgi:hypothetical protein